MNSPDFGQKIEPDRRSYHFPKIQLYRKVGPMFDFQLPKIVIGATAAKAAEALVSSVTNCKQLIDCLQITILPRSRVIRITLTDYVQR